MEAKPLLRWAGSKRKQLPYIFELLPPSFDTYIEPFVGSGQLFFNITADTYIINDINSDLINFYSCIKENYLEVFRLYSKFPKDKEFYYFLRAQHPPNNNIYFDAARFLYLNENCFNGLYRVNSKGEYNVPYSKLAPKSKKNVLNLKAASEKLNKTIILNTDFEYAINKSIKKDSFFYIDPPYAIKNRTIFNQYDTKTFGLNDLDRLDNLLDTINGVGAKFLVSYVMSEEISFISEKWISKEIPAYRSMSGFKEKRKYQVEKLIMNY